MSAPADLATLRAGGKPALARALARLEAAPAAVATLDLLDDAWAQPRGSVVGLTGPPGVGKSTLASALVRRWRAAGATAAVIAVDPSSRRTRGAVLGDRTRIDADPMDEGVFVRSMAARDRLGGLADGCAAATVLMRALFDVVLVETVGVGQSETEIADLVDTVVFAIQPGAGDGLQYMKAGIIEIPDVAVVTKADLGALAERARRDVEGALALAPAGTGWRPPVVPVAAADGTGLDELQAALDRHAVHLREAGRGQAKRAAQARAWLEAGILAEFGRRGLRGLSPSLAEITSAAASPFRWMASAADLLGARR